jgi:uncharacterized metal-binding protein YceD (DUF177 family)
LKHLDQYIIHFGGLKDGIHNYQFEVDDRFFGEFELSEVRAGKFKINVLLDKKPRLMVLKFEIDGIADLICDRCLDVLHLPVSFTGDLYVKYGQETLERIDEILVLSYSENEINISQFIYESINLSIPLKRIHPDDENGNPKCNNDMLKIISKMSVTEEHKNNKDFDPRWKELQKLVNNN